MKKQKQASQGEQRYIQSRSGNFPRNVVAGLACTFCVENLLNCNRELPCNFCRECRYDCIYPPQLERNEMDDSARPHPFKSVSQQCVPEMNPQISPETPELGEGVSRRTSQNVSPDVPNNYGKPEDAPNDSSALSNSKTPTQDKIGTLYTNNR
jgi:hypothetical protein